MLNMLNAIILQKYLIIYFAFLYDFIYNKLFYLYITQINKINIIILLMQRSKFILIFLLTEIFLRKNTSNEFDLYKKKKIF